jgi:hypothetical protein
MMNKTLEKMVKILDKKLENWKLSKEKYDELKKYIKDKIYKTFNN